MSRALRTQDCFEPQYRPHEKVWFTNHAGEKVTALVISCLPNPFGRTDAQNVTLKVTARKSVWALGQTHTVDSRRVEARA